MLIRQNLWSRWVTYFGRRWFFFQTKIFFLVSDAILDACLSQDKFSRVACETAAKTGMIMVLGEITTKANLDYQKIIRETIKKIGYDDSSKGEYKCFFL